MADFRNAQGQASTIPVPAGVLVEEPELWTQGVPGSVMLLGNPDGIANADAMPVFPSLEDARQFANTAGMSRVRPLAVGDIRVFAAILSHCIQKGASHVFRFTPELPGIPYVVGGANELLALLAADIEREQQG